LTLKPGQKYIIVERLSDQSPSWIESPDDGTVLVNTFNADYGQFGYIVTLSSGQVETRNDFGNYEEELRGEGLTPGFWKSNAANAARKPDKFGEPGTGIPLAWVETGIVPDDLLTDVPPVVGPGFIGFPAGPSFVEALNTGGGGVNALMRHAAAAYLNAAHPCVDYPLTTTEIVTMVNAALASGNSTQIEDLKNLLDGYNNAGADLDQFGRCADDAAALLVTKSALKGLSSAPAAYSAMGTSVGVSVVDEAMALSTVDSSTSAPSVAGTYLALSAIDSPTSVPSVGALDVAFGSVAMSNDILLLGIQMGSDNEGDTLTDAYSLAGKEAKFEPMVSILDDVFELLSVA